MPLIPSVFQRGACFLYKDVSSADKNEAYGGTAFLIGVPLPKISQFYGKNCYFPVAVSNVHVVHGAGATVIRFNKKGGGKTILDLTERHWIPHPKGDDIALAAVFGNVDWDKVEHSHCPIEFIMTEEEKKEFKLGVGDEVFMVGRFVNHQGDKNTIRPTVRFGNLSMMPSLIRYEGIKTPQLSYAVEMKSRKGFSGSPVLVYRNQYTNFSDDESTNQEFFKLLGINLGFVREENPETKEEENTWLNGVLPAWKIFDILKLDEIKDKIIYAENVPQPEGTGVPNPKPINASMQKNFNKLLGIKD